MSLAPGADAVVVWFYRFGAQDYDKGTGGIRLIELLGLISRTPAGKRIEDCEATLVLDPVTDTDRMFALSVLLCICWFGRCPASMQAHAQTVVRQHGLVEAFLTLAARDDSGAFGRYDTLPRAPVGVRTVGG